MANILDAFKEKQTEKKVYDGKKIKVGIIGCGWIAEAHLKSYLKCDDVEVVAFADIVPGKAEAFAKQNGVEGNYYLSDKELIDNEKDLTQFPFAPTTVSTLPVQFTPSNTVFTYFWKSPCA